MATITAPIVPASAEQTNDNGQILTIQQHILREQKRFPDATGEFSWLMSGITLATKMIAAKVRRAGLTDILGEYGSSLNVQGETQQKLDVYANQALMHCLSVRKTVRIIASEENEEPLLINSDSPSARYAIVFDPLDGSSNIDVGVSVGTVFSVFRKPAGADDVDPLAWLLSPGRQQVAAGYVLYGSSTVMVYSVGNGVHAFTLDPAIGAYVLSHSNIRIPEQGSYYSVNEANRDSFPEPYQKYLEKLRSGALGKRYSSRYIGSMVADFHRTLIKGGVFLYPPTASHPKGKLRLLYEASPIAFMAEQAGGQACCGTGPVLDIKPESIHQRTPLMVGGKVEMDALCACLKH